MVPGRFGPERAEATRSLSRPTRSRAVPALVTALLFAGSFVAAKLATVDLGPLTTSLLRYLVALAFLGGLVLARRQRLAQVNPADLWRMGLLGLFGIVGYHYFFFTALRHTDVVNTAILNAGSPVVTGVLAALFLGERLPARSWLGVALAFVGVVVLLAGGEPTRLLALQFRFGDLLMLVSVTCWAIYALLIKRLSLRYDSLTLTFQSMLFGIALLVPLALTESPWRQLTEMSSASALAVLYMGVAASGVGYLLYNRSIERLGPTRTSSIVYSLQPVLVSVLTLVFFDEPITVTMALSTLVIVSGVNLALGRKTEPAAARR